MHRRIARCLVGLCACLVANAVPRQLAAQWAQWEPPLRPGSLVRVSHTDPCCRSPQVGSLVSVGPDSVVIRARRGADTARIAMPRSAVKFLEHSWVTRSYGGRGTVLGVLAGVATGLAVLAITAPDCQDCWGAVLLIPYVAAGGAILGGVIGWAIGRSVHTEEWRLVRLLPRRVGIAPDYDRGLAVRLTLRL
jgi:hypothetical protein